MAQGSYLDNSGQVLDQTEEERQRQAQAAAAAPSTAVNTGFDASRVPAGVPTAWAEDFLRRNPGDYHRLGEAYGSERDGGRSPVDEWANHTPQTAQPAWYAPWFETLRGRLDQEAAESKARSDSLYGDLLTKIHQSTAVTADDPNIANQVGAFRAEQERQARQYLSALAEKAGPYANLRGEQRMTSARTGQAVGTFQAKLLADEVNTRRAEIMQALNSAIGFLSNDKRDQLTKELAYLDQYAKERGLDLQEQTLGQDWRVALMGNDLALRNLALNEWDRGNYYDLLRSGALG